MADKSAGQVAYEAYVEAVGGRSLVTGAVLPAWSEQAERISAAWQAAAVAVIDYSLAEL